MCAVVPDNTLRLPRHRETPLSTRTRPPAHTDIVDIVLLSNEATFNPSMPNTSNADEVHAVYSEEQKQERQTGSAAEKNKV